MERSRDMVFCHECENEWYRDEHGLSCPECRSDFTEIIEAQHDPRHVPDEPEQDVHPLDNHNPWARTPDPAESNMPNYSIRTTPQGGISMSFSHTISSSNNPRNPAPAQPRVAGQGQVPDMGTFAAMMNSIMGAVQQSATNPPHAQSPDGQPNVRVFTGGGPNFQYTATTRLAPRNANDPQAHAQNVDVLPLPELLSNFLQPSPRGAGPEPAFAPLGFGNLFANLFNPANAQHGDAVYSQEAFDRIISQLMDQNHANNAPGPASSEAIAALPQRRIAKEDVDESTGKADCSICMDEAPIGSQVTYLPCSHWFHADCIRAWLGEHDTCPHCRQGIMARDGPEDATRPREPGQAPRHDRTWGQAEGSRQDPINMSESPTQQRTSADAASATGTTSGATLFSRMRDAFGGGGNDTPPPPPGTS